MRSVRMAVSEHAISSAHRCNDMQPCSAYSSGITGPAHIWQAGASPLSPSAGLPTAHPPPAPSPGAETAPNRVRCGHTACDSDVKYVTPGSALAFGKPTMRCKANKNGSTMLGHVAVSRPPELAPLALSVPQPLRKPGRRRPGVCVVRQNGLCTIHA